ncbi:MAG: DUF4886 domain-containing protein [Planctomycetaceae bacterium]
MRLLVIVVVLALSVASSAAAGPDEPLHVLFVGNSYTFANDLPGLLAKLSVAGGRRPIVAALEAPGGCTFEKHVREGRAERLIASRAWDYVVLQEQSMLPVVAPKRMLEWGPRLDAAVHERGARTLLFQTWARAGQPDMQPPLVAAYDDLAEACNRARAADGRVTVVPVGEAWQRALATDPPPTLHKDDGSHPTLAGTYIAACTFYAVIYNASPVGLPGDAGGLDDAMARRLQQAAWAAVDARDGASVVDELSREFRERAGAGGLRGRGW